MSTAQPNFSLSEINSQLLENLEARERLLNFTTYTKPDFEPSWHHEIICGALEEFEQDVADKKSPRLLIEAPPRHTKSELASRRFPAWCLGRHPTWQYISTTYSGDFANDFGRDVRDVVSSSEYGRLFDTRLRADSAAVNRWQTTDGGIYVSVGVGGPITGRGAHVAGIDDPIKNQQDADSETVKDNIWAWYTSTLYTRLMSGGGIVMILTRWAEDDLAGRALDAEDFRRINLPAITAKGEALWPSWFDLGALKRIKHALPPRQWQALYMQDPTPEEGTYFSRETISRYRLGEEPEHLHRYITTDFAVTEKDDADFTVFGDWGVDSHGDWWLLDRYRDQSTAAKWVDTLANWIKTKGPLKVLGESGVIRRAIEDFLKQSMKDKEAYTSIEWITRNRDKVAMAAAFRGLVEQGKIHIPLTDWGEEVVTELLKFPAGEHDDQVDMCTLLGLAVTQGVAATIPEPEDVMKQKRDYDFELDEEDSWKTA